MVELIDELRDNAGVSKRELSLGLLCSLLTGIIIGMIIGSKKPRLPKAKKKAIIERFQKEEKPEGIVLSREDYD